MEVLRGHLDVQPHPQGPGSVKIVGPGGVKRENKRQHVSGWWDVMVFHDSNRWGCCSFLFHSQDLYSRRD